MEKNNFNVKRRKPESAFVVLLRTLFTSRLLSNTEDSTFLKLKKQLPFFSEKAILILNQGHFGNIIYRPKRPINPFLFFQLLFSKEGRKKLYEAFWK
jgi:hypothetical protein